MEKKDSVIISSKKQYMYVNVILTFNTSDAGGDHQEFFNLYIPVSRSETNLFDLLNKKFFKRIVSKCKTLNRRVEDLIKISTASDWILFEKVTGLKPLCDLGHPCKWYFGKNRRDLDRWELMLMEKFHFGIDQDMSWTNDEMLRDQMIAEVINCEAAAFQA